MVADEMQINIPAAATELVREISILEPMSMVADSAVDPKTLSVDDIPRNVVELSTDPDKLNAPWFDGVETVLREKTFPSALTLVRCADETASAMRNNRQDRIFPTDRLLGGSVDEKTVTSAVKAEPALTDSLVKSSAEGAAKVISLADVRAKPEYHPAASDGLPG